MQEIQLSEQEVPVMIRPLRVLALFGATLLGFGCTGSINPGNVPAGPAGTGPGVVVPPNGKPDPGNGGPPVDPNAGKLDDSASVPGAAPLRRLTVLEYQNTIRDLLGVSAAQVPTDGFPRDLDSEGAGYFTGAKLSTGDDAHALSKSADAIADLAVSKLAGILPCSPIPAGAAEQDTCAGKFIAQFGQRAFRRPLSTAEVGKLTALYKAQRAGDVGLTFEQSIGALVGAIVQTPYFLYHWELGPNAPKKDGNLIQYNPWEMASRLSYLLWASMPDDKLFASAQAGGLTSPEQIAEAARRLLADPKAKDAITDFHYQWLEIFGLKDMPKDPSFMDYSPAVADAMTPRPRSSSTASSSAPRPTGSWRPSSPRTTPSSTRTWPRSTRSRCPARACSPSTWTTPSVPESSPRAASSPPRPMPATPCRPAAVTPCCTACSASS